MTKILVVEDEDNLLNTLRFNLEREGYEVNIARDGRAGLHLALTDKPNLVILDLMLPLLSGTEVLQRIRRQLNIPVLLLTARSAEADRVQGLDLGADDYITKPFALSELLARVRAHLRRQRSETDIELSKVAFGEHTIDLKRRELSKRGALIALQPKEYELLAFLVQRPGRVFSRDELLDSVWNIEFSGGTRTVDVHIRWLRQKIEADPSVPRFFITVRGAGYRFEM